MPIIKSAKKRVKVAASANLRNAKTKRTMREALKVFSKAVSTGSTAQIIKAEREAVSAVDKATKKAVIHKNKAARIKSRLAAQVKAKGVKPTKSPAKATPAKLTAKTKSSAKSTKAITKKAVAKKPVAKKVPAKK